jgi:hypothetical protein
MTSSHLAVNGQSRYARVSQKVSGKVCVCVFFVVVILLWWLYYIVSSYGNLWTGGQVR